MSIDKQTFSGNRNIVKIGSGVAVLVICFTVLMQADILPKFPCDRKDPNQGSDGGSGWLQKNCQPVGTDPCGGQCRKWVPTSTPAPSCWVCGTTVNPWAICTVTTFMTPCALYTTTCLQRAWVPTECYCHNIWVLSVPNSGHVCGSPGPAPSPCYL
jgi:hypothetical protein